MYDPYLYKDTNVLKNKLDIRDENVLDTTECRIATIKLAQIKDVKGDFDYQHYKNIHKFIFGDIYDWAGEEREIPVQKGEVVLGGMSVQYAYPSEIKKEAKKCIAKLNKTDWSKLPIDERAERFAKNIAALWQVHPFREGNTRTAITFACEFAEAHGFPMDKQLFTENARFTRDALVLASIGQYSEYEHLTRIFKDSMERGEKHQHETKETKTKSTESKSSRYDTIISDPSVPIDNTTNTTYDPTNRYN